jgi:RND superfamily putative drug exporter
MARWTLSVIRHRKAIIAAWIALFLVGGVAAAGLGDLLSNRFSVPGADSERGLALLKDHMNERSDGAFTLVVQGRGSAPDAAAVAAAAQRGARAIEGGRFGAIQRASPTVAYVQISTPLENQDAAELTPRLRRAIGAVPGAATYVSGYPALNHDTQPIYNKDLTKGESFAVPIAILVMAFMFGTVGGIVVPLVFAAVSIPTTLGLVWIFAHFMDMAIYVTNIVTLIGFAIAIDYSMLVVFRFREELEVRDDPHDALVKTMQTAGRATLFSGLTVAVGLALLVFMPLPFMRSMGVGGLLVPLVSIAASATFLPALLAVMGRGVNRFRVIPRSVLERRAAQDATGAWHRFALAIMRRPVLWGGSAAAVMLALALAGTGLHLTGGDNRARLEDPRGDARAGRPRAAADRRGHPPTRRRLGARGGGGAAPAGGAAGARPRDPAPDHPRAGARHAGAGAAGQSRGRAGACPADPRRRAQRRGRDRGGRPGASHPRALPPGGVLPGFGRRTPHRGARLRRRLHRQGLWRVSVARARGARALLPAPAAGLPVGGAPGQGRPHEPPLGERDLRRAHARLPARLG